MGDDEFFGTGTAPSTMVVTQRNPLTLDELTSFSKQLLHIAFTLYWYGDKYYIEETSVPGLPNMKWIEVRNKATNCLQAIHARE